MLILTRRVGESVMIGDNIKVTTLGVKGSQVRLGFEAPDDIGIHREEGYLRIKEREKVGIGEKNGRDKREIKTKIPIFYADLSEMKN